MNSSEVQPERVIYNRRLLKLRDVRAKAYFVSHEWLSFGSPERVESLSNSLQREILLTDETNLSETVKISEFLRITKDVIQSNHKNVQSTE